MIDSFPLWLRVRSLRLHSGSLMLWPWHPLEGKQNRWSFDTSSETAHPVESRITVSAGRTSGWVNKQSVSVSSSGPLWKQPVDGRVFVIAGSSVPFKSCLLLNENLLSSKNIFWIICHLMVGADWTEGHADWATTCQKVAVSRSIFEKSLIVKRRAGGEGFPSKRGMWPFYHPRCKAVLRGSHIGALSGPTASTFQHWLLLFHWPAHLNT